MRYLTQEAWLEEIRLVAARLETCAGLLEMIGAAAKRLEEKVSRQLPLKANPPETRERPDLSLAKPGLQGALVNIQKTTGTWRAILARRPELLDSRDIVRSLGIKLSTFMTRFREVGFPKPYLLGCKGRGKTHVWRKEDVIFWLEIYEAQNILPPIYPHFEKRRSLERPGQNMPGPAAKLGACR